MRSPPAASSAARLLASFRRRENRPQKAPQPSKALRPGEIIVAEFTSCRNSHAFTCSASDPFVLDWIRLAGVGFAEGAGRVFIATFLLDSRRGAGRCGRDVGQG